MFMMIMPHEKFRIIGDENSEEDNEKEESMIHITKVVKDIPICCICTGQLLDDLTVEKKCRNVFHNNCIEQWMRHSEHCPICKVCCTDASFLPIRYEIRETAEIPESQLDILTSDELQECVKQYKSSNDKMKKEYEELTEELQIKLSKIEKMKRELRDIKKTLKEKEKDCISLKEKCTSKDTKNAQLLVELEEHKKELKKYEMVLEFLHEIKGNAKEHFFKHSEQQLTNKDKHIILGHYVESLEKENQMQKHTIKKLETELQEYKKKEEHLNQKITDLKVKILMSSDDIDSDDLRMDITTQEKNDKPEKTKEEIIIKNKNIRRIESDKLNSSLKNVSLQKRSASARVLTNSSAHSSYDNKQKYNNSEKELFGFDYNAHVINGNNPNSSFCLGRKPDTPLTQKSLLSSSTDFHTFMGKNFPNLNASPLKKTSHDSSQQSLQHSNDTEEMSNIRISVFMKETQIENVNKHFTELTPKKHTEEEQTEEEKEEETEESTESKYFDSLDSPNLLKSNDSNEKSMNLYFTKNTRDLLNPNNKNTLEESKEQEDSLQWEEPEGGESTSTLHTFKKHFIQMKDAEVNPSMRKTKTEDLTLDHFISKTKTPDTNYKFTKSKTVNSHKKRKTFSTQINKITDFFKPLQQ